MKRNVEPKFKSNFFDGMNKWCGIMNILYLTIEWKSSIFCLRFLSFFWREKINIWIALRYLNQNSLSKAFLKLECLNIYLLAYWEVYYYFIKLLALLFLLANNFYEFLAVSNFFCRLYLFVECYWLQSHKERTETHRITCESHVFQ